MIPAKRRPGGCLLALCRWAGRHGIVLDGDGGSGYTIFLYQGWHCYNCADDANGSAPMDLWRHFRCQLRALPAKEQIFTLY